MRVGRQARLLRVCSHDPLDIRNYRPSQELQQSMAHPCLFHLEEINVQLRGGEKHVWLRTLGSSTLCTFGLVSPIKNVTAVC